MLNMAVVLGIHWNEVILMKTLQQLRQKSYDSFNLGGGSRSEEGRMNFMVKTSGLLMAPQLRAQSGGKIKNNFEVLV